MSAMEAGDIDAVRGIFSDSEDLVAVGSDPDEWYQGAEEVIGIAGAQWRELALSDMEILRLDAFENGETGWAVIETRDTVPGGITSVSRATWIFQLEAGSWKVVHNHTSIPVANVEAYGIELTRTLSDLVESIDQAEAAAMKDSLLGTSTVVFTDIVGSTAISQAIGDARWAAVVSAHFEVLGGIVEEGGGKVVKTLGDGAMFAFSAASSALDASVRMLESLSDSHDPEIQIRIGIHTGDVRQVDDDYLGLTVHKAARVAAAAGGNEVLVSAITAGMVNADEYRFGNSKTLELPGIEGQHTVVALRW